VADLWASGGLLLGGGCPIVDKVGAEELKLGCWKMVELRSDGGMDTRVWWVGELGVTGRSFVFERGGDSKDNGGNIGGDVSVGVPCNDE
jgi:hypothetical protein